MKPIPAIPMLPARVKARLSRDCTCYPGRAHEPDQLCASCSSAPAMKAIPARLDPKGDAKPLTRIISQSVGGTLHGPGFTLLHPELEDESGKRTPLTAMFPEDLEKLMAVSKKEALPNDYEACGECNLDHAYEPVQSLEWHKKNPGSYDTHYVAAADCPGTGKASKWHDTVDDEWLSCPNCKAQWATSEPGALTVPPHKIQYKR